MRSLTRPEVFEIEKTAMFSHPLVQKFVNLLERYQLALILALLGIIFLGIGLLTPVLNQPEKEEIVIKKANNKPEGNEIKVDVSGAVAKPGVYSLKEGSRVLDAIASAGGFSDQVDSNWLAKNLNLAALVSDGQKIYVNTIADAISPSATSALGAQTIPSKISINTASITELDTLPGVGKVTAEKIIAGRPYKAVDELLTRKIVGKATFEKIKDLVTIY